MAQNPSSEDKPSSDGLGVATALIGIVVLVVLKINGLINEWPPTTLIFLSVITGFAVEAFPRLEELSLGSSKLSVRLREVNDAEERIYAREETIQKLMLNLADLAVMDSLNFSRLSGAEYGQLMRQWRDKRIDTILSLVEAIPEEKATFAVMCRFTRA